MENSYDINAKSEMDQSGFEKFESRVLASRAEQQARPDYDSWLAHGKKLCAKHSAYQWAIGDWLNDGRDYFDPKEITGDIPGYLLLTKQEDGSYSGPKDLPKFWADAAAIVQMGIGTLKQYALVAAIYPKKKRVKRLSWYLHLIVCGYERRYEYLNACIEPDGKIHSGNWLYEYAARQEGEPVDDWKLTEQRALRIAIPDKIWNKLRDLQKYYGTPIGFLTQDAIAEALSRYLNEKEYELSLKLLEHHEPGVWPLDKIRKKTHKGTGRIYRDKQKSERVAHRQGSLTQWERKRERLQEAEPLKMVHAKPVSIRRLIKSVCA